MGRPHIAQALVDAGHVATSREAFDLYLNRTSPAYVERFKGEQGKYVSGDESPQSRV